MREFIKRYWLWGVVLLILMVSIPNILFVIGNCLNLPLHTAGIASENLSLYGSALGALATIGAVMATIAHTEKSQKTDRVLSLKRLEEERAFSLKCLEEERDSNLKLLKKQLINERKTRDLERIKVCLQDFSTMLAPSRFADVAASMSIRNHREKATQLLSMGFDCAGKITGINLIIADELFDETLNRYVSLIHEYTRKLTLFIKDMSEISILYLKYETQEIENKKTVGAESLYAITDKQSHRCKELLSELNKIQEYGQVISKTKEIIKHLERKLEAMLDEEKPITNTK